MKTVTLRGGRHVPALGQGSWFMGENADHTIAEVNALRLGLDLGMTLIDTAEMYADGGAERVVGQAIVGRRDDVVLVSKVYPQNASRAGVAKACEASLARLGTDRIDLYLLHWRGSVPLAETVAGFERLVRDGKIGAWGVSNFDPSDLAELAAVQGGNACAANQVLYNPQHRGIEFDLLSWCAAQEMPVMAYSPIGQGRSLLQAGSLAKVAARHKASAAQIAIAWGLRQPGLISIPKAANLAHVRQNAAAAEIVLAAADLAEIDAAFPPPMRRMSLAML
jgi:diketogulonate reductase-like aldo/keto reductase